jgi:hypothetical protein
MHSLSQLSGQLSKTAAELRELEKTIKASDTGVDLRILLEFRQAIDQIRLTSWAVQKWLDMRHHERDRYGPLALLMAERIRRATQLNNDLARDFASLGQLPETEGVLDLRLAVERLLSCLEPFSKKRD